ncbi:hypothetical protein FQR65_LT10490 [Abscondita terminalis]|nr:hypothetical protein FQR65_LT10490 [Abscondita terminalis]
MMISDEVYVMQVDPVEDNPHESLTLNLESNHAIEEPENESEHVSQSVVGDTCENESEIPNLNTSEADDGQLCPICLDNWTSSGDHRICALKCGHIFGYSCINRWLTSQREKNCPTCKKKSSRSDFRFIYARKLIAMDNSELEYMKAQFNKVVKEKSDVQIELTKAICREHAMHLKVEQLQKTIKSLDKALQVEKGGQVNGQVISEDTMTKLYIEKSLEICKEGGCRVFDCCTKSNLIVASMKSPNSLFPGYGVRQISISLYKPTAYIPLHLNPIRDIKFHSEKPWLLSVSLDKTAKITDINTTTPVCFFKIDSPLWSCCWDSVDSNYLYLGQQRGSTIKFDIRNTSVPVNVLEIPGDMSPVVSVASVPRNSNVASDGVVICKLNSLWFFKLKNDEYSRYPLPVEGPFISMSLENETQQLLISSRPTSQYAYTRHNLCYLETDHSTGDVLCRNIHCLQGGSTQKFLSRSCFISHNSQYYVAAHQESNRNVSLWNVQTGNMVCYASAPDPVLDLCGINLPNTDLMVSLTEKKLIFYKFP